MQQTKLGSLVESIFNIFIGYGVAIASQLYIFPKFGINVPIETNLMIGGWFTVVSLIRSYILRRIFNSIAFGNIKGIVLGKIPYISTKSKLGKVK